MQEEEEVRVLEKANPLRQEPLVSEVEIDPMAAEQTWPTEEEEGQGLYVCVCMCVFLKTF